MPASPVPAPFPARPKWADRSIFTAPASSIIDTVFVCRDLTEHQQAIPFNHLEALIRTELAQLQAAGMRLTHGDIRCITYGHLTRLAVLTLYPEWDDKADMTEKLSLFGRERRRPRRIWRSSSTRLMARQGIHPSKPRGPNRRRSCPMQHPFEVPFADVETDIETTLMQSLRRCDRSF